MWWSLFPVDVVFPDGVSIAFSGLRQKAGAMRECDEPASRVWWGKPHLIVAIAR
jgi:hypothetical protein